MAHDLDSSDSESYRRGEKRSLDSETGSAISIASKRSNLGSGNTHIYLSHLSSFLPSSTLTLHFMIRDSSKIVAIRSII